MLESKAKKIGDALIAWFAPRVSSLGLVSFAWHPHMRSSPVYPANPRAQCPRAFLRVSRVGHVEGLTLSCPSASLLYQCSIWVQIRQTPGQEHQQKIVEAVDVFHTALLQAEWRFEGLPVAGLTELKVLPDQSPSLITDELDHPLGEAALRVSCAEIQLLLEGQISG